MYFEPNAFLESKLFISSLDLRRNDVLKEVSSTLFQGKKFVLRHPSKEIKKVP